MGEDDIEEGINFFENIIPRKRLTPAQKARVIKFLIRLVDSDLADVNEIVNLIQLNREIQIRKKEHDNTHEDFIEGLIKETRPPHSPFEE
jgi:hypothetical protein